MFQAHPTTCTHCAYAHIQQSAIEHDEEAFCVVNLFTKPSLQYWGVIQLRGRQAVLGVGILMYIYAACDHCGLMTHAGKLWRNLLMKA